MNLLCSANTQEPTKLVDKSMMYSISDHKLKYPKQKKGKSRESTNKSSYSYSTKKKNQA